MRYESGPSRRAVSIHPRDLFGLVGTGISGVGQVDQLVRILAQVVELALWARPPSGSK